MVFTTRVKIILKKHGPKWLFSIIRFIADITILPLIAFLFSLKTSSFKKRMTREVTYGKGKCFSIIIDPKNGYLDAQIYSVKLYEPHIVKEFVDGIHEGDTCIDIGANIGHHTIIMSQAAGGEGKVYAYEPIPYIREQMEESLALNHIHNVVTLPEALSTETGTMVLRINKENVAGSSFVSVDANSEGIPVAIRTLDSYNYKKVNFIKLDVEGFEYAVLQGGEKTIETCRPRVLFEFSPEYYRRNNPADMKNILTFFKKHNYTLLDLEDRRKTIADLDTFIKEFDRGLRSQTNILALP